MIMEVKEQVKLRRPGWVYFAYAPEVHRCKIGWTANTPQERFAAQTDSPGVLNVWGMLLAYEQSMERTLHEQFSYLRIKGEWFAVDERLRTFVCEHTYKNPDRVSFVPQWTSRQWQIWDEYLADDHKAQECIKMVQSDPVVLIRNWKDPTEYFYRAVKDWIVGGFGYAAHWRGENNFYRTEMAYDLIYEMCYDLLPV